MRQKVVEQVWIFLMSGRDSGMRGQGRENEKEQKRG